MHLLTVSFIISTYVYSSDNQISCNDATTVFSMVLDFFKMAWKSMEMAWNFILAQVYEPCPGIREKCFKSGGNQGILAHCIK